MPTLNFTLDTPGPAEAAHLTVRGEFGLASAPELRRALTKVLLDRGGVLVDVSAMTVSWAPALTTFASTLAEAGGWPLARMVLVGPDPTLAAELRSRRLTVSVPCAGGLGEARELLERRPREVSRRRELPGIPQVAALARSLSTEVCQDWDVPELAPVAGEIAGELAANAVRHAGTGVTARFTLGPLGLFVGARDWRRATEDELLAMREPADGASGLALVKGLAHNWGVTEHVDGKTVWAALSTTRVHR